MPANTELRVAIRLTGIQQLRQIRDELRAITQEAERANQALARTTRGVMGGGRSVGMPGAGTRGRSALGPTSSPFGFTPDQARQMNQALRQGNALIGRTSGSLQRMGQTGQQGFRNLSTGASRTADQMGRVERFAKLTQSVLEAYLLYRGFVFLSEQVQQLVDSLIELESNVALVQTQLNELGAVDFQSAITSQVRTIAAETGSDLQQIAETQFDIVSANIELADSYEVLEATARGAIAGGVGDLRTVFNAAITQQNAFGESAGDTNEVLDKQFQALRRGIFTYEQFVQVSGTVSTAMASIGQNVETANAALAAISQVFTGPQLERGATGLRNMATAVGKNAEEFRDLGVEVFTEQGEFRDFLDIMLDLREVLDGMTEEQRFMALREIFPNRRELRGALALLGQLDEMEQFLIEQEFAAGAVDAAFQTMNDTMKNQAEQFRNDLIPAGEKYVRTLSSVVSGVNELEESIPGLTAGLLTLGLAGGVAGGARAFAPTLTGAVPLGASFRGGGQLAGLGANASMLPRGQAMAGLRGGLGVGGMALVGAGGLLSFQAGRSPETQPGQVIGALAGGAAAGGIAGGAPGAVVGATVAGIGLALGEAFEDEAPQIAQSFSDAFTERLEANADDVSNAFLGAILESDTAGGLDELVEALQQGRVTATSESAREAAREGFMGSMAEIIDDVINDPAAAVANRIGLGSANIARQRGEIRPRTGIFGEAQLGNVGQIVEDVRQARLQAERQLEELPPGLRDQFAQQIEQAPGLAAEAAIQRNLQVEGQLGEGQAQRIVDMFSNLVQFAAETDTATADIESSFNRLIESADSLQARREELVALDELNADQKAELIQIDQDLNNLLIEFGKSLAETSSSLSPLGLALKDIRVNLEGLSGPIDALSDRLDEIDTPLSRQLQERGRLVEQRAIISQLREVGASPGQPGILEGVLEPIAQDLVFESERVTESLRRNFESLTEDEVRDMLQRLTEEGEDAASQFGDMQAVFDVNIGQMSGLLDDALVAIEQGLVNAPNEIGQSLSEFSDDLAQMQRVMRVGQFAANLQNLFTAAGRTSQASQVGAALEQFLSGNLDPLLEQATPMAEGGIVREPTFALIGEAGPEAVIPLDEVMEFADGGTILPLGGGLGTNPFGGVSAIERAMEIQENEERLGRFLGGDTGRDIAREASNRVRNRELGRLDRQARGLTDSGAGGGGGGGGGRAPAGGGGGQFRSVLDTLLDALKELAGQTEETTEVLEIPAATQLDETMFEASRVIEMGLIDPMGFTSDQLQAMGEDFRDMNRVIRKANLIKEFERVAGIVQPGVDLTENIKNTLGELQLGGDTLSTLLNDPERLAEFITSIEFGDVTVDQSTRNQFTIRISGAVGEDPRALSRIADQLVNEINARTREATSF